MTNTTNPTHAFRIGRTYTMRSLGDYDCVWTFRVIKRTAKFITIQDISHGENEKPVRVGVYVRDDEECARPFGSFSMAPSIRAGEVIA